MKMKKKLSPLKVSRETIRDLSTSNLDLVVGGAGTRPRPCASSQSTPHTCNCTSFGLG